MFDFQTEIISFCTRNPYLFTDFKLSRDDYYAHFSKNLTIFPFPRVIEAQKFIDDHKDKIVQTYSIHTDQGRFINVVAQFSRDAHWSGILTVKDEKLAFDGSIAITNPTLIPSWFEYLNKYCIEDKKMPLGFGAR